MKRFLAFASLALITGSLHAQVPEDVLKYSWQPVSGTARVTAIGGAMGSLGGDISSTFTNPAGLAFYRTSEFVVSPGFSFLNNKASFRGTNDKAKDNSFNLGPTGFVGGMDARGSWANKTFSIAVNRTANFNNRIQYSGQNDFSSFAEQYAADAASTGQTIDDMLGDGSRASLGTRMALYNFLVDTVTLGNNSNPDFISQAMYGNLAQGKPFLVNQTRTIETTGGITEIALGYAGNKNDKFYIGGSIGIPIVNYSRTSMLREEDATADLSNRFNFAELTENYTTRGFGVNLKLGVIFKPVEPLRIGVAIHTPSVLALTDTYSGSLSSDLDSFRTAGNQGVNTVNSSIFTNGANPRYEYDLNTPWKFMVSGAYVLHSVEDVSQQKGFITAEAEYVTQRSSRFQSADGSDDAYYDGVNTATKDYYKNALNFRVGGEMKFNTVMGRLGFAYYGNPYSDSEFKASRTFLSGGLGYRNGGIFVDLTYQHALNRDISFPYRLDDKGNTFSEIKGSGSNVMLTFGVKI